jgi:hypothetical protein
VAEEELDREPKCRVSSPGSDRTYLSEFVGYGGRPGVNCPMRYLSEWNAFNPNDRETYPKVNAPVQVTYEGGRVGEGFSLDFFPASGLLSGSLITRWRYIKQEDLP